MKDIGEAFAAAGYAATLTATYPNVAHARLAHDAMVKYELSHGGCFAVLKVFNRASKETYTVYVNGEPTCT